MQELTERNVRRPESKPQTDGGCPNPLPKRFGGGGTALLTDPRHIRSDCQLIGRMLDLGTADPELVQTLKRRLEHHSRYGATLRIQLRAAKTILLLGEKERGWR